jgi:uncharacterized protein
VVRSPEFADEAYLSNPRNRCLHCKRHLYATLDGLSARLPRVREWTVLSGANVDDLGEYRPGLDAAAERGVRHPYIEAQIDKAGIRAMARAADLDFADLPASPCLASRLYTETRVTAARLRAVEIGEEVLGTLTGIAVSRCRVRDDHVLIEVAQADRSRVTVAVIDRVASAMRAAEPRLISVRLDPEPYRPGRAFEGAS